MTNPTSSRHRLVAGCVALVYMAPVIYAALRYGQSAVQNLFAADAYYYFTIAKNTPGVLASSDGTAPTNGFHPLWQYLLIGVWRLVGAQETAFLWAAFALNSAVALAAVYVLDSSMVTRSCTPMPDKVLDLEITECSEDPSGEMACCIYGHETRDIGEGPITKTVCVARVCRRTCKGDWIVDNAICLTMQDDPRQEAQGAPTDSESQRLRP